MRLSLPRPPLRAVIAIAVGWVGLRAWLLWPDDAAEVAVAHEVAAVVQALPAAPQPSAPAPIVPVPRVERRHTRLTTRNAPTRQLAGIEPVPSAPATTSLIADPSVPPEPVSSAPPPAPAAPPPDRSRWSGWAYFYARPGSGRTLAAGGQLGGSQVAARVAYRLTGRFSLAARAYAPLAAKSAEAAVGADVAVGPLHLVGERRIGLDRAGRDAWSAYATTGLYREAGPLVIDAYAQAGIVGARRRDGFIDGAVRAGSQLGRGGLVVGAGLWGAVQPGAARLDVGPRVAWTLPGVRLIASVEGRLRVAGKARPGSGFAFTLARDF